MFINIIPGLRFRKKEEAFSFLACGISVAVISIFRPDKNWQQAGVLLLEDTSFTGKSMRVSFAYNDYNGGYLKSRSILLQAITSLGNGFDKPEEIAHIPLFNVDSLDRSPILYRNLENSALRIEKHGNRFRILFANGMLPNTALGKL